MAFDRQKLIASGQTATRESRSLEFKREFDTLSAQAWCEVIKDIVAFANTDGGIIVFGLENDGHSSGVDCSALLPYDLAEITNKIFKYTGHQFSDIEIIAIDRGGKRCPVFVIAPTDIPIVFIKPGTYDVGQGNQKTAFSQGTVYFRHGAKSEPGNREDFARWRDKTLAAHRKALMQGMRKVVEAPAGHAVTVVPMHSARDSATQITARITTDPSAPKISIHNTDELWPHRRGELLKKVAAGLPKRVSMNGHDLLCVNKKIDVFKSHPAFAHRPHKLASPQYSEEYAEWIIAQTKVNPQFFAECRNEYRKQQMEEFERGRLRGREKGTS